jgi:hypothetical protein
MRPGQHVFQGRPGGMGAARAGGMCVQHPLATVGTVDDEDIQTGRPVTPERAVQDRAHLQDAHGVAEVRLAALSDGRDGRLVAIDRPIEDHRLHPSAGLHQCDRLRDHHLAPIARPFHTGADGRSRQGIEPRRRPVVVMWFDVVGVLRPLAMREPRLPLQGEKFRVPLQRVLHETPECVPIDFT